MYLAGTIIPLHTYLLKAKALRATYDYALL